MTEVFRVNKVCEWPFLQQMKVCFNALKMCYGVSTNTETDSILPPPPPPNKRSPPPPPPPQQQQQQHTHLISYPPPF